MLKQDAATPLYEQLMNEVEKKIREGYYKPGDKIATEAEMAKEFGVSLITAALWFRFKRMEGSYGVNGTNL